MKPYIIKNVKGIGKGLFANKDFKEGELILKGDLSKLKSYSSAEAKKLLNTDHLDYVGKGRYVNTNQPYSYMNHSCDPNVLIKYETIARSKFYAMKDIKKGEQLTYDYGVNALDQIDVELWTVDCKCGAESCRGKLSTCFLKQPVAIQKKYYPYLPPSIKKKYRKKFIKLQRQK